MALADLKRGQGHSGQHCLNLTVDQFISRAEHYAAGEPTIKAKSAPLRLVSTKPKPLRKASYTISEQTRASLNQLAERTGYSRSRIIRILVHHIATLPRQEQLRLLARFQVR
ncbi:hypothetical protein [Ferrimonas marina]|uniref:Plasmid segregation centromere-binding protein ParG n=1 Tax=Ferrimonas marina TaxID=299255 RepID=A0A1M5R5Y0_9GAMM|nr:hypothetical protein [Ferrimonas marina]SHH21732.1 plasmid segregation centromere-binding protein ParG [Ferrimonas marina]